MVSSGLDQRSTEDRKTLGNRLVITKSNSLIQDIEFQGKDTEKPEYFVIKSSSESLHCLLEAISRLPSV